MSDPGPFYINQPSNAASLKQKWSTRLPTLQRHGVPEPIIRSLLSYDINRVKTGQQPLSDRDVAAGVLASARNTQVNPEPEPSGLYDNTIGAAVSDLRTLLTGLPQLPSALIHEAQSMGGLGEAVNQAMDQPDAMGKIAGLAQAPGVRMIPGAYTVGNIASGNADELVKHPVFTLLDVLPVLHSTGAGAAMAEKLGLPKAKAAIGDYLDRTGYGGPLARDTMRRANMTTRGVEKSLQSVVDDLHKEGIINSDEFPPEMQERFFDWAETRRRGGDVPPEPGFERLYELATRWQQEGQRLGTITGDLVQDPATGEIYSASTATGKSIKRNIDLGEQLDERLSKAGKKAKYQQEVAEQSRTLADQIAKRREDIGDPHAALRSSLEDLKGQVEPAREAYNAHLDESVPPTVTTVSPKFKWPEGVRRPRPAEDAYIKGARTEIITDPADVPRMQAAAFSEHVNQAKSWAQQLVDDGITTENLWERALAESGGDPRAALLKVYEGADLGKLDKYRRDLQAAKDAYNHQLMLGGGKVTDPRFLDEVTAAERIQKIEQTRARNAAEFKRDTGGFVSPDPVVQLQAANDTLSRRLQKIYAKLDEATDPGEIAALEREAQSFESAGVVAKPANPDVENARLGELRWTRERPNPARAKYERRRKALFGDDENPGSVDRLNQSLDEYYAAYDEVVSTRKALEGMQKTDLRYAMTAKKAEAAQARMNAANRAIGTRIRTIQGTLNGEWDILRGEIHASQEWGHMTDRQINDAVEEMLAEAQKTHPLGPLQERLNAVEYARKDTIAAKKLGKDLARYERRAAQAEGRIAEADAKVGELVAKRDAAAERVAKQTERNVPARWQPWVDALARRRMARHAELVQQLDSEISVSAPDMELADVVELRNLAMSKKAIPEGLPGEISTILHRIRENAADYADSPMFTKDVEAVQKGEQPYDQILSDTLREKMMTRDYADHFTERELASIVNGTKKTWGLLKEQGFDPVWIHHVTIDKTGSLSRPRAVLEREPTPGQTRLRVLNMTPYEKNLGVALSHQAYEWLQRYWADNFLFGSTEYPEFAKGFFSRKAEGQGGQMYSYSDLVRKHAPQIKALAESRGISPDAAANAIIRKSYVLMDPTDWISFKSGSKIPKGVAGRPGEVTRLVSKPAEGEAGVVNQLQGERLSLETTELYAPKSVAKVMQELVPSKAGPTFAYLMYDKAMDVFRVSAMGLSPRFQIYNIVGGAIMGLARTGPEFITRDIPEARRIIGPFKETWERGGHNPNLNLGQPQGGYVSPEFATKLSEPSNIWEVMAHERGRAIGKLTKDVWGKTGGKLRDLATASFVLNEWFDNLYRTAAHLYEEERLLKKGATPQDAYLGGLKMTQKILQDWDSMMPWERHVMRNIFPFYGWVKHILKYTFTFPFDHPLRASILASIVRNELIDQSDPLGDHFRSVFFLGNPDEGGSQWSVNLGGANPFADVADMFTLQGFLSQLSPAMQAGLEMTGVDMASGRSSLYPDVTYDPESGRLIAAPRGGMESLIGTFVPQYESVAGLLGFSQSMQELAVRNPDAWMSRIASGFGVPLSPRRRNRVEEVTKAEMARQKAATEATRRAMRTGDWTEADKYPTAWIDADGDGKSEPVSIPNLKRAIAALQTRQQSLAGRN